MLIISKRIYLAIVVKIINNDCPLNRRGEFGQKDKKKFLSYQLTIYVWENEFFVLTKSSLNLCPDGRQYIYTITRHNNIDL